MKNILCIKFILIVHEQSLKYYLHQTFLFSMSHINLLAPINVVVKGVLALTGMYIAV